jgi:uncharacterized protein
LFPALFAKPDHHVAVVRALSTARQGMTRAEIAKLSKIADGGTLTKVLEELEQSSFIQIYYPFAKQKKEKIFRLTDEYILFYLRFMERHRENDPEAWNLLSQTPAALTWMGYAFENLCMKHIPQIKKAMGISSVFAPVASFYQQGTESEPGAQIDLVMNRRDHVVNLFEVKFSKEIYILNAAEAQALRQRMGVFRHRTATKSHLSWCMITTFGLRHNQHSLGLVEQVVTLNDFF